MARGRVPVADIQAEEKKERENRELLLHKEDHGDADAIELAERNVEARLQSWHSPKAHAETTRVSFLWIAVVLALTVIGFTINTEATAYFEDQLGWKKPFATLYITHSSLGLPWMCHIAYLRWTNRKKPFRTWCREYCDQLSDSVAIIDAFSRDELKTLNKLKGYDGGPLDYLATVMGVITVILTVSGASWFFSLALTTPADLTAIYNCSTFFAAIFSVPLLKERLSWLGVAAVAISIAGTLIITYGDAQAEQQSESAVGTSRLLGNLIAIVGAVAFGLYEVLFKKWACSSKPESAQSSLPLTLAASALTGFYTFVTLWVGLVVLHVLDIERLELPSVWACLWIIIAVVSGSFSITLLVVLILWTDPVFGSMSNVLSVFVVALADWLVWNSMPSVATYIGGALICVAFLMLSKDSLSGKPHGQHGSA